MRESAYLYLACGGGLAAALLGHLGCSLGFCFYPVQGCLLAGLGWRLYDRVRDGLGVGR